MKKALLVMVSVLSVGCGATPKESAFVVSLHAQMCDRLYECLSVDQRAVPFSFYLGETAADCKAVFENDIADVYVTALFGARTFIAAEADKCTAAVKAIPCDSIRNLAALQVSPKSTGLDAMGMQTIIKDGRAKLGVAVDFSCNVDATTCRADAGCSIGVAASACAIHKWAPFKDANAKAKENQVFSETANAAIGCGITAGTVTDILF